MGLTRASRPAKPNAGPGLKAALTMQAVDRSQLGTESKICACCGFEFERPTHTKAGRRQLRQPMQWKRQRFCSAACVRHYRLEGPFEIAAELFASLGARDAGSPALATMRRLSVADDLVRDRITLRRKPAKLAGAFRSWDHGFWL